jgi:hypothetical protein
MVGEWAAVRDAHEKRWNEQEEATRLGEQAHEFVKSWLLTAEKLSKSHETSSASVDIRFTDYLEYLESIKQEIIHVLNDTDGLGDSLSLKNKANEQLLKV